MRRALLGSSYVKKHLNRRSPSSHLQYFVFIYLFILVSWGWVSLFRCGIRPLKGPLSHLRMIDEWVWNTDGMTVDWDPELLDKRQRDISPGATWYPINSTLTALRARLGVFSLYYIQTAPLLWKTYKELLIRFHLTSTKCTFCPYSSV